MPDIVIRNESQQRLPLTRDQLFAIVRAAVQKLKIRSVISIIAVTPAVSRSLNRKYRKKDRATNILTFIDGPEGADILFCPSVIRQEARRDGETPKLVTARLIAHGLLHVSGNHHRTVAEERRGKRLTNEIVRSSGLQ